MWIYYYASYGPGHQGEDYGFEYFNDSVDNECISENLQYKIENIANGYGYTLMSWKVDGPPADYVEQEIKAAKDSIKHHKKHLKMLEDISCFVKEEKDGEDKVIQRNLRGKVDSDIVRRLHKAGLMYSNSDLSKWYRGEKCPTESKRSKILSIIRRSKSYSKD